MSMDWFERYIAEKHCKPKVASDLVLFSREQGLTGRAALQKSEARRLMLKHHAAFGEDSSRPGRISTSVLTPATTTLIVKDRPKKSVHSVRVKSKPKPFGKPVVSAMKSLPPPLPTSHRASLPVRGAKANAWKRGAFIGGTKKSPPRSPPKTPPGRKRKSAASKSPPVLTSATTPPPSVDAVVVDEWQKEKSPRFDDTIAMRRAAARRCKSSMKLSDGSESSSALPCKYKVGQKVSLTAARKGVISYVGKVHFARGDFYGVELTRALGVHNGTVDGRRYFKCPPKHGVFVSEKKIIGLLPHAFAPDLLSEDLKKPEFQEENSEEDSDYDACAEVQPEEVHVAFEIDDEYDDEKRDFVDGVWPVSSMRIGSGPRRAGRRPPPIPKSKSISQTVDEPKAPGSRLFAAPRRKHGIKLKECTSTITSGSSHVPLTKGTLKRGMQSSGSRRPLPPKPAPDFGSETVDSSKIHYEAVRIKSPHKRTATTGEVFSKEILAEFAAGSKSPPGRRPPPPRSTPLIPRSPPPSSRRPPPSPLARERNSLLDSATGRRMQVDEEKIQPRILPASFRARQRARESGTGDELSYAFKRTAAAYGTSPLGGGRFPGTSSLKLKSAKSETRKSSDDSAMTLTLKPPSSGGKAGAKKRSGGRMRSFSVGRKVFLGRKAKSKSSASGGRRTFGVSKMFSRSKKSSKIETVVETKPTYANPVFGVDPMSLVSSYVEGYSSPIPDVLTALGDAFFALNGHLEEGIFRIAPSSDNCKEIKHQLNSDYASVDLSSAPIHTVANLIKVWFRDLPLSALQHMSPGLIEHTQTQEQCKELFANDEFPQPQQSLLLWLMDLCVKVSVHKDTNKMNTTNLGIVMSPNLFDHSTIGNPMRAMTVAAKLSTFVKACIDWRVTCVDT